MRLQGYKRHHRKLQNTRDFWLQCKWLMQHESHNYEDIAGARTVGLHCGPTGNAEESCFFKERSVRGDQGGTWGRFKHSFYRCCCIQRQNGELRYANRARFLSLPGYRLENVAQKWAKKEEGAVKKNSERSLFLSHDCDMVWCVQIVKSPFFVLFFMTKNKNKWKVSLGEGVKRMK